MTPVNLSELIDALELESVEHVTRVDLQNGCVVSVECAVLTAVEEDDQKALDRLRDWRREEVEIARAMADDSGERFVAAPRKYDFHEYRQMERFIGSLQESAAAEQLWQAIKGKGAFRYFRDTVGRLGLLKEWYQYRDQAVKEFVKDWAEAHKVPVVDDTRQKPKS